MAHKRFQPVGCVGGHGVRQCCRSCAISTPYNIAGREQAFDHDVNKQVRKSGGRQIVVDEVGDRVGASDSRGPSAGEKKKQCRSAGLG